jgi:hypothetical protein
VPAKNVRRSINRPSRRQSPSPGRGNTELGVAEPRPGWSPPTRLGVVGFCVAMVLVLDAQPPALDADRFAQCLHFALMAYVLRSLAG